MDTPYLPQNLFKEDFKHVYEPAEDTFLLLDALEKDLESFNSRVQICLEIGSGSGTVITALSKSLKNSHSRLFIATDINDSACRVTKKCAKFHDQGNIHVINSDLAKCLMDRLEHQVDLLLFNPPYVPTEDTELNADRDKIFLSWAGGKDGRILTNVFLQTHVPRLLSKPEGTAYLVALESNNITDLLSCLKKDHNILGEIAMERKAGIEKLYVIKYRWAH